jgi:hypothetical protein
MYDRCPPSQQTSWTTVAVPSRQTIGDDNCCNELRKEVATLKKAIASLEGRLKPLEALEKKLQLGKGFVYSTGSKPTDFKAMNPQELAELLRPYFDHKVDLFDSFGNRIPERV